jgi:hypothetical protein
MNGSPAVIVNKSGFLASVAKGVFGTIMVTLVCATALGVYALRTLDQQATNITQGLFKAWPEWQDALPPVLADALDDHRAPDYRKSVEVSARLVDAKRGREGTLVVVDVKNNGPETVTLLALRLVVEDANKVPVREALLYAATPLATECEWRGPLLPGSGVMRIPHYVYGAEDAARVTVEIRDIRVADKPDEDDSAVTLPVPVEEPAAPLPLLPPTQPKPARTRNAPAQPVETESAPG